MERDFSKEYYHRIIKKTKTHCTVILNTAPGKKEPIEMPWDEFNKIFIIKDGIKAYPTDEQKEKADKINDKLDTLCVYVMRSQAKNFKSYDVGEQLKVIGIIGGLSEELQKELNCSMMDIMRACRHRIDSFKRSLKVDQMIATRRERLEKIRAERGKPDKFTPNSTQTLGDLPGFDKLKKSLINNNKSNIK